MILHVHTAADVKEFVAIMKNSSKLFSQTQDMRFKFGIINSSFKNYIVWSILIVQISDSQPLFSGTQVCCAILLREPQNIEEIMKKYKAQISQ